MDFLNLKTSRKIARTIFPLALGVLVLWLLYKDTNMAELWRLTKSANFYIIAYSLLFGLAGNIFRALRWELTIQSVGYYPKRISLIYAVMGNYAVNFVLPRAGEVWRCGVITKYDKIPFSTTFGTLIVDRFFDVLAMAFLTFFNSEKPILFPDVTYSFYDVWADFFRIPYKTCALDGDWHICPEDYKQENGGVIFPNPNAPTGLMEDLETVEEIIQANPNVVVIVDEAYVDFGGVSVLPLINKYENLLVVQTFSKSRAMAGMRIGFAMGNKKLIKYLNDAKFSFNSYTMNRPSLVLGVEAIKDKEYFEATVQKIITTRERVKKQLTELGFSFPDSKTNFIFASHKTIPAKDIFEALKKHDIYVRYWNKERLNNSLRISIGTDEEMDKLVAFLTKYIGERVQ